MWGNVIEASKRKGLLKPCETLNVYDGPIETVKYMWVNIWFGVC